MRHHSYNETAVEAWSVGCSNLGDILANLSNVQKRLMAWDYEEYGNVRKELSQFRQQLEEERTKCLYSGPSTEEHFIMNRLAKVLAREEIMEKQRVDWLKARGRNTSFFHAKAKQRSRVNNILHLKRDDGSLCTVSVEIKEMTTNFYKALFTTQDHTYPEQVIRFVP
jgi:exonuclease VII large subunit